MRELRRRENPHNLSDTSVSELAYARARCLDRVVKALWRDKLSDNGYALVAVGGYGAGALHPHSDIDLLVLRPENKSLGRRRAELSSFTAQLWDLGLTVGYSLRTQKQCLSRARHDITIMSSLMDMRLIAGRTAPFDELREKLQDDSLWPLDKFLRAKLAERRRRERLLSAAASPLQPNVKNSRGGLRDLQTISLLARRAYKTGDYGELAKKGTLKADECKALKQARDFLWRLRWALHTINRRPLETLHFDQQIRLAFRLGYGQGTEGARKLLRSYYLKQQSALRVETIFITQLEQQLRSSPARPATTDSLTVRDGYLEINDPKLFDRRPELLIALFARLKNKTVRGISANALRLIYQASRRIDDSFRDNPDCHKAFIDLLRGPGQVARALSAMAACGALAAYWPAFEKIIGLAQFDMFHIYPVDQHTLTVIANLSAYRERSQRNRKTLSHRLFRQLPKKELLHLAALFHDICKGRHGDHSNLGADEALAFCLRHGLDEADAQQVAWLVRHHLLMSMTAQRKDISDPQVVRAFAERVGGARRLRQLYLLTIADIKGTNPEAWNAWKDALLFSLYQATEKRLRHGEDRIAGVAESGQPPWRSALLQLEKKRHAAYGEIWRKLPDDYFLHSGKQDMIDDAEALISLKDSDKPFVRINKQSSRGGSSSVTVFSRKSRDLFARLTRVFSLNRLNTVSAYLGSSASGHAVNRFLVLEPNGRPIMSDQRIREIENALYSAFRHRELPAYRPPIKPSYRQGISKSEVDFEVFENSDRAIIELHSIDHSGLLCSIADVFLELDLRIVEARINTIGQQVNDLFKVYSETLQLADPQAQKLIRKKIRDGIDCLPGNLIG